MGTDENTAEIQRLVALNASTQAELRQAWDALPESVSGDAAPKNATLADRISALDQQRQLFFNTLTSSREELRQARQALTAVRREALLEAAKEVHIEARYQEELRYRDLGLTDTPTASRAYMVARLATLERILHDRAALSGGL